MELRRIGSGCAAVVSLALMAVSAGASAEPEGGGAVAVNAVERMEAALQRYRLIAERGGWPRVGEGPKLAPGDIGARVAALRQRLAATGDWQSAAVTGAASRYDQALEEAVTAFQRRHGLEADGVVGARTRRALDVPASQRVARIAANLRRIRARPLGDRDTVVQVNIPDFRVSVYEDGRATFATRAIVGRPEHATPSLETHIEAVILNPAWNVPRAIVREDLADRFARKDGYAERNGFHAANSERPLAAFDWDDKPMVPVRQAPGPSNALGRIKFHMPNDRAIYLHDTPKKHLFDQRPRAFSAGCVRVERPMALAARLTGLERDRLAEMAAGGETRSLRFGWRIPVQLVYFTAWVDTRGRVQFRRDIYDRDERALAEAR